MAFGLAAYASPGELPHTTQDSLPAVGQTLLDGLLPAGFQRKVSECLHLLLLSRALPGAITSTAACRSSARWARRLARAGRRDRREQPEAQRPPRRWPSHGKL